MRKIDDTMLALLTTGASMAGGAEEVLWEIERNGILDFINDGKSWPVDTGKNHFEFEKMGLIFGAEYDDYPIFRRVSFPEGWKLQPSESSDDHRWCVLVDSDGNKRANVFYKALPHDRRAHAELADGKPYVAPTSRPQYKRPQPVDLILNHKRGDIYETYER